ncbi:hypothetical protein B0J14DRAFT_665549 [Halenospora varia]|nr:hypothetical protein B0J14DRAFT_665549 [Halenospora varia]
MARDKMERRNGACSGLPEVPTNSKRIPMKASTFLPALAGASVVLAQHNTSSPNGCNYGLAPGTDTVIFTTPYTYRQVMSIIGSFKNLTWSGSPDNTVTLNGTDNTVGTSRTYDIVGAHVVETITTYSKPPNGPYEEIHTLNLLTIPSANVSFYGDYDGTTVTPICNGRASTFNFTINFCASNATLVAVVLHTIHLTDAQTVGTFLGGNNYTSCTALSNSTTNGSSPTTVPTSGVLRTAIPMSPLVLGVVGVLGWMALL